jgi:hypothetical protein
MNNRNAINIYLIFNQDIERGDRFFMYDLMFQGSHLILAL